MLNDKYLGRFTRDGANYILTARDGGLLWVTLCAPDSTLGTPCRSLSKGEWVRMIDKGTYRKVTHADETKIGGTGHATN